MSKSGIAIILLALLSACDRPHWINAGVERVCTDEQWERVEKETLFCKANTATASGKCLGSAMIRNCNRRKDRE